MKDLHVILSDEEMYFVNQIKKKYELKSQGVSIRFLIQEAMSEVANPDQKYKDLLSQNEDNTKKNLISNNETVKFYNFICKMVEN